MNSETLLKNETPEDRSDPEILPKEIDTIKVIGEIDNGWRIYTCVCDAVVKVPADIEHFRCYKCSQVTTAQFSEEERQVLRKTSIKLLHKWVIRSAIDKEIDKWLTGSSRFSPDDDSLVSRIFQTLCQFPLFEDESNGVREALLKLFELLPDVDKVVATTKGNRSMVRRRFLRYIAGAIFYATFTEDDEPLFPNRLSPQSRGAQNSDFKTALVAVLRELGTVEGTDMILESIGSSHSIEELSPKLVRLERVHLDSAVSNMEHSLALKSNKSKLRSLYHLTPRRLIIQLLRKNTGMSLSSAFISILFMRPFGGASLFQRILASGIGLKRAERLAKLSSARLIPGSAARIRAFIIDKFIESDFEYEPASDEEIFDILENDSYTEKLGCPPIENNKILLLRGKVLEWQAKLASMGRQGENLTKETDDVISIGDCDESGESSADEDYELDATGKVFAKQSAKRHEVNEIHLQQHQAQPSRGVLNDKKKNPLFYYRMFYAEELKRLLSVNVLEILGDDVVQKIFSTIFPICRRFFLTKLSVEGSGGTELIEGLFRTWSVLLKTEKNKNLSTELKRSIYRSEIRRIHELIFQFAHNLIRGDASKELQRIVHWLADFWRMCDMEIDFEAFISDLSPEDRENVEKEANFLRVNEIMNNVRELGTPKSPSPKLNASWALVDKFKKQVLCNLFKKPVDCLDRVSKPSMFNMLPSYDDDSFAYISHIEVVYSYEDDGRLTSRGYKRLPINFSLSRGVDSWLWVRRLNSQIDRTAQGISSKLFQPITDIRIVRLDPDAPLDKTAMGLNGYIRMLKPLDKRNHFIWYSRSGESSLKNIMAINMDLSDSHVELKMMQASGYRLVAPLIENRNRNFFGFGSRSTTVGLLIKK